MLDSIDYDKIMRREDAVYRIYPSVTVCMCRAIYCTVLDSDEHHERMHAVQTQCMHVEVDCACDGGRNSSKGRENNLEGL